MVVNKWLVSIDSLRFVKSKNQVKLSFKSLVTILNIVQKTIFKTLEELETQNFLS